MSNRSFNASNCSSMCARSTSSALASARLSGGGTNRKQKIESSTGASISKSSLARTRPSKCLAQAKSFSIAAPSARKPTPFNIIQTFSARKRRESSGPAGADVSEHAKGQMPGLQCFRDRRDPIVDAGLEALIHAARADVVARDPEQRRRFDNRMVGFFGDVNAHRLWKTLRAF